MVFVKSLELVGLKEFIWTEEAGVEILTGFLHSLSLSSLNYSKTAFCSLFHKFTEMVDSLISNYDFYSLISVG